MTPRIDIDDMTDAQDARREIVRLWGITHGRDFSWHQHMDISVEQLRADLARPSQAGDERVVRLVKKRAAAICEAIELRDFDAAHELARTMPATLAAAPQPEDDHPDIPDTPEERAYRKGWNEGFAAGHKLVPIDDPAAPQLADLGQQADRAPEPMAWAVLGEDGKMVAINYDRMTAQHLCNPGERIVRVAIRVVEGGDDE